MGASVASVSGKPTVDTPRDSELAQLEQAVVVLREHATAFARAPLSDKVAWLRQVAARVAVAAVGFRAAAGDP